MDPKLAEIKKKLGPAADKKINYVLAQAPGAVVAAEKLKLNPSFILSQTAFESGWGQSDLAKKGNLAGIKARKGQPSVAMASAEGYGPNRRTEISNFRTIDNPQNFFEEYAKFIGESPRYKSVPGSKTVDEFVDRLHGGGFFTEKLDTYKSGVSRINKDVQYILDNLPTLSPSIIDSRMTGVKE